MNYHEYFIKLNILSLVCVRVYVYVWKINTFKAGFDLILHIFIKKNAYPRKCALIKCKMPITVHTCAINSKKHSHKLSEWITYFIDMSAQHKQKDNTNEQKNPQKAVKKMNVI